MTTEQGEELFRLKSEQGRNDIWRFSRWAEEYAFVHNLTIEQTLNLALFKSENLPYVPVVKR